MRDLLTVIRKTVVEGEPPLRVPAGPAQLAQLEALKREILAESPGTDVTKWDRRQVLIVKVVAPGVGDRYRYTSLSNMHVSFVGDELQVSDGYHTKGAPLSGLAQLRRLVAAVQEELREERRREQKRDKLRKLRERSIEAQVEALAASVGFAYALEPMATKVKLVVRLDARNGVSVDLPHKRVQEILAALPRMLAILRELYQSGARFKVVTTAHLRFRDPRPA